MTAPVTDAAIEAMILQLCERRGDRTICPSEVARALAADAAAWRALMPEVRRVAAGLVADGRIVATQRGRVIDPVAARGPIRLAPADRGIKKEPDHR